MNKIYIITTMTKLEQNKLGWPEYGSTRTVGWYESFNDAEKCVVYNNGDIWETCYDYAIIEEVEEGLYPYCKPRWFYKYNIETGEYERIEEPELMKHIVCIGIG